MTTRDTTILTWNGSKYTIYGGYKVESCHAIRQNGNNPRHWHIATKEWWQTGSTGAWLPVTYL